MSILTVKHLFTVFISCENQPSLSKINLKPLLFGLESVDFAKFLYRFILALLLWRVVSVGSTYFLGVFRESLAVLDLCRLVGILASKSWNTALNPYICNGIFTDEIYQRFDTIFFYSTKR